ncbi:hypothetical protein PR202_ga18511 [Eleusine coracana subsp. coracana]|uniref:Uncharacterized protein n=1 Tax=Eleusine coracana subsp. coracana TaxID=191504 RepID=A0AAV5CRZ2_ELECO|nr:hypothetical protein PR202_ga18511 [Eleusine coracana subsp. coracana]
MACDGLHRRKATLLLIIFLLAAAMAAHCVDGSRSMPTKTSPKKMMGTATKLFAYIPQAKLIPPSGPSERHNSIGLDKEVDAFSRSLAELSVPVLSLWPFWVITSS